jgi:ATP-binding cassette subfamily F protein 3
MLIEQRRDERRTQRGNQTAQAPKNNRKLQRQERAALRAKTGDLRSAVKKTEKQIGSLNIQREELERRLAQPDVYGGSTNKLMELQVQLGDVKNELKKAEEDWLKMSTNLEKPS